ncbi:MAG: hypothetical protein WBD27_04450 [Pyrinomonadaceae bacterium]
MQNLLNSTASKSVMLIIEAAPAAVAIEFVVKQIRFLLWGGNNSELFG